MEKITDVYVHVETKNSSIWFKNGRAHREGGEPAVINTGWGARKAWLIDGEYNLPHIEYDFGTVEWRYTDRSVRRKREEIEEYYKDYEIHRDERDSDGLLLPARVNLSDRREDEYYLNGKQVNRMGVRLDESSEEEEEGDS